MELIKYSLNKIGVLDVLHGIFMFQNATTFANLRKKSQLVF